MKKFTLTPKQSAAWTLLTNTPKVREILVGGAAGGGKSFFGCLWILKSARKYASTRWVIARKEWTTLATTTLATMLELLPTTGMVKGRDYRTTGGGGSFKITLANGSVILFMHMKHQPSDPNYSRLGGLEITGAFVDEADEVTAKAWEILGSRIRYKITENGLTPKLLGSCNPNKNWIKERFYDQVVANTMPDNRAFVPILLSDNPHADATYPETLSHLNEVDRGRLLNGDWEYATDSLSLFPGAFVEQCWDMRMRNYYAAQDGARRYITADVARQGVDKTVIVAWQGMLAVEARVLLKSTHDDNTTAILGLARKYGVERDQRIIVDADGVGIDEVTSLIKAGYQPFAFHGGSPALHGQKYKNLKSQCYVHLSQQPFGIAPEVYNMLVGGKSVKELISSELGVVKQLVGESRVAVNGKDAQKQLLGRSPDFADCLMQRALPLINPKTTTVSIASF